MRRPGGPLHSIPASVRKSILSKSGKSGLVIETKEGYKVTELGVKLLVKLDVCPVCHELRSTLSCNWPLFDSWSLCATLRTWNSLYLQTWNPGDVQKSTRQQYRHDLSTIQEHRQKNRGNQKNRCRQYFSSTLRIHQRGINHRSV